MSAHTSFGADKSTHTSLGAQTSLYVRFFAPGPYMLHTAYWSF